MVAPSPDSRGRLARRALCQWGAGEVRRSGRGGLPPCCFVLAGLYYSPSRAQHDCGIWGAPTMEGTAALPLQFSAKVKFAEGRSC